MKSPDSEQCQSEEHSTESKDSISHGQHKTGEVPNKSDEYDSAVTQSVGPHSRITIQYEDERGPIQTDAEPVECTLCSYRFTNPSHIKRHMLIHTSGENFICYVCGKEFTDRSNLKSHMYVHTGERPFKCTVCSKGFKRSKNLRRHMHQHAGSGPFQCLLCNKDFTAVHTLTEHMQSHTCEKPFSCPVCSKEFEHPGHLKRHVATHTDARPECSEDVTTTNTDVALCEYLFDKDDAAYSKTDMTIDIKIESKDWHLYDNSTLEAPVKTISADVKSDCQPSNMLLNNLSSTKTDKKCPENFVNSEAINKTEIDSETDSDTDVGEHYVEGKAFRDGTAKAKADGDVNIESSRKPDDLQYTMDTEHYPVTDVRVIYTGEKSYKCTYCGKACTYKGDLKKHILTHTGERPFKCQLCSKAFIQSNNLKRHMATHTNVKVRKKRRCARMKGPTLTGTRVHDNDMNKEMIKQISASAALRQEIEIIKTTPTTDNNLQTAAGAGMTPDVSHFANAASEEGSVITDTAVVPSEGQIGNLNENQPLKAEINIETGAFPTKSYMDSNKHSTKKTVSKTKTIIYTSEKPYKCRFCDRRFIHASALKQHMFQHTGEKPFKCNICSKTFRQTSNLKRHLAIHTNPVRQHPGMKRTASTRSSNANTCIRKDIVECPMLDKGMSLEKPREPFNDLKTLEAESYSKEPSNMSSNSDIKPVGSPIPNITIDKDYIIIKTEVVGDNESTRQTDVNIQSGGIHGKSYTYNKNHAKATQYSTKMRTYVPEKRYTCHLCNMTFIRPSAFIKHMYIHTGERPFKCRLCGEGFTQTSNLKRHMNTHIGEKYFAGQLQTEDKEKESLSSLYTEHPELCEQNNDGSICDGYNSSEGNDYNTDLTNIYQSSKTDLVICKDIIHSPFTDRSINIDVTSAENLIPETSPEDVDVIVKTEVIPLDDDFDSVNETTQTVDMKGYGHDDVYQNKSYMCNKNNINSISPRADTSIYISERPYRCDACNMEFVHHSAFKKHMYIHTGEKPFVCHVCNKGFTQTSNLKRHMNTHMNEKSLEGQIVIGDIKQEPVSSAYDGVPTSHLSANGLTTPASFVDHINTPTEIEPLKLYRKEKSDLITVSDINITTAVDSEYLECNISSEPIDDSSIMVKTEVLSTPGNDMNISNDLIHERDVYTEPFVSAKRMKTVEKKATCHVCYMEFKRCYDLKTHMYKHSGERPYICHVCSKGFTKTSNLKRHLNTHPGASMKDIIKKSVTHQIVTKNTTNSGITKKNLQTSGNPDKQETEDISNTTSLKNDTDAWADDYILHPKDKTGHSNPPVADLSTNTDDGMIPVEGEHSSNDADVESVIVKTEIVSFEDDFSNDMPPRTGMETGPHGVGQGYDDTIANKTLSGFENKKITSADEKPFTCPYCDMDFVNSSAHKTHMYKHSGERPFLCHVCSKGFTQTSNLKRHMNTHRDVKYCEDQPSNVLSTASLSMTETSSITDINIDRAMELAVYHVDGKDITCTTVTPPTADTDMNMVDSPVEFQAKKRGRPPVKNDKKKRFRCQVCGLGFAQNTNLRVHMFMHTGEKPFTCHYCRKGFTQSSNLYTHMRTHTGEKPFVCQVCNKGFRVMDHLKMHMNLHTGEKPYACKHCELKFAHPTGLTNHMFVHTGKLPFKCAFCDKRFRRASNLNTHMKIHTGEKPFVCPVCSKGFTTKGKLKSHFKKKHM